ncbi:MAG: VCBS repeat-containing protein [Bdellovibrionaceae bacterium]|nr:VCBS repeat-containing protein [Bdellovibrionales bacterium]MCB9083858.1 VCBS repeat-containing protein [Pseudobdellovibrionaceae bacterium]
MKKRLVWGIILFSGIAIYFWTQSRYPALGTKAAMGDRTTALGIAFDIIWNYDATSPLWQRILAATGNWCYTNWKGMTFGLLFAAVTLTMLGLFSFRRTKSVFLNSVIGVFFGAPLGVCANCVAPIAQSLKDSGASTETTLATAISSPTLNVVVLSMAFTLFPFHFALTKLILTFVILFAIIPVITKYFLAKSPVAQDLFDLPTAIPTEPLPVIEESWVTALYHVLKDSLRKLVFVSVRTVPFMLLAGFLGSALIESLPFDFFTEVETTPWSLVAIALFGTLLPVPIAFDVVMASSLMSSGLPSGLTMTLLFTLGIFSIYPLMLFWTYISRKVALTLFLVVVAMGSLGGAFVHEVEVRQTDRALSLYDATLLDRIADFQKDPKETTRSIVERECLGSKTRSFSSDVKAKCEVVGILEAAMKSGKIEICQLQQKPEDVKECESKVAYNLAFDDISRCEQFPNPKRCKKEIYLRYASGTRAVIWECRDSGDPDLNEYCNKAIKLSAAIRSDNPKECEAIPQEDEWRDNCLFHRAYDQIRSFYNPDAIHLCDLIKNNKIKSNCYVKVASTGELDVPGAKGCDSLDHRQVRLGCLRRKTIVKAMTTMNPSECLAHTDPEVEDDCFALTNGNIVGQIIQRLSLMASLDQFKLADSPGTLEKQDPEDLSQELSALPQLKVEPYAQAEGVEVSAVHLYPQSTAQNKQKTAFELVDGRSIGLDNHPNGLTLYIMFPSAGKPIASGDLNNDGWPDLVLGGWHGPEIYMNMGGSRFRRLFLGIKDDDLKRIHSIQVLSIGLVDLNNDGWLDVFFTTMGGQDFTIYNDKNLFRSVALDPFMPDGIRVNTIGTTFGDIDRNGLLDVVLGNMFSDAYPFWNPESRNEVFLQTSPNQFKSLEIEDYLGETLSILLSDANMDGHLDLFAANDFTTPDSVYWGPLRSPLKMSHGPGSGIPISPQASMSFDTADVNNDGLLDIFISEMTFAPSPDRNYCEPIADRNAKTVCQEFMRGYKAVNDLDMPGCLALESGELQIGCSIAILIRIAGRMRDSSYCSKIPDQLYGHKKRCEMFSRNVNMGTPPRYEGIPQKTDSNIMLVNKGQGQFEDQTKQMGVGSSFWAWNARFADIDNDGWQDIYVANGANIMKDIQSNVLFHSKDGKEFREEQHNMGLGNFLHSSSFTFVDLDLDGDLDLVSTGALAPPQVFFSQSATYGANISFTLRDMKGNRFGIGSKITIEYKDPKGQPAKQIREIKAGGGYGSFDEPVAYFGLGGTNIVDRVTVQWSTGETTEINEQFGVGTRYTITRNP